MKHYVYIIESTSGNHYIGFTSNPNQRLYQHNNKHHGSTYRISDEWKYLINKEFPDKSAAMKVEKYLKSLKNWRKAKEYMEKSV